MSKCNTRKMKDGGKVMKETKMMKEMVPGKVMKETKMMKEMGRGETKAKMQEMNPGMVKLKKAAPEVAKKMGYKKGGMTHKMPDGTMMKGAKHGMKKGGSVTRGDGACMKGHTKGKMV
jgi:hypothetical protein